MLGNNGGTTELDRVLRWCLELEAWDVDASRELGGGAQG